MAAGAAGGVVKGEAGWRRKGGDEREGVVVGIVEAAPLWRSPREVGDELLARREGEGRLVPTVLSALERRGGGGQEALLVDKATRDRFRLRRLPVGALRARCPARARPLAA